MDKTFRLTAGSATIDDTADHSGEMMLMALVVGVMSAVTAEAKRQEEQNAETNALSQLAAQLPPNPGPEFSPYDVLRIQLAALKTQNLLPQGRAIETAWNFCTPESHEAIGCLDLFARLFDDPMYAPLAGFEQIIFLDSHQAENNASLKFEVHKEGEPTARYIAHLRMDDSGPLVNCWLTDSILRICL